MATRRKKAEKAPETPKAFTVGVSEPEESSEEYPPFSEEGIDGILALRGHLSERTPQLIWPLHTSLTQHLSDLESATEAVDRLAVRHAMSSTKLAELRRWLLSDAYAFTYLICRHRDIVPEVHMAMCYASSGQAQKLAWLISQSGFENYAITQFREACRSHGIDPSTREGVDALYRKLHWQDQRWPRGWYKSSAITHGGMVIEATNDPDETVLVVCAKEDKAFDLVEQCGATIKSGIYNDFFPDRVPDNARDISKTEIKVKGRTVSAREKTLQGASYISREIGGHYSKIRTDDIVIRDVRGGIIGGGEGGPALRWLHGMRGMRIMSREFWRIHVGTINDCYDDDHAWLTYGARKKRVVSIVVPAEIFPNDEFPDSVMVRGTPSVPTFFPEEKIIEALEEQIADETEVDGVEAFRSDFWLAPTPNKLRIFEPESIGDPYRAWIGPIEHPRSRFKGGELYKTRFLVARYDRNDYGIIVDAMGHAVAEQPDWQKRANVLALDPWEDLDIVITVNPTWNYGAKKWAISVVAADPKMIRYQLESRIDDDGIAGWARELPKLVKLYKPRVIGIEAKAWIDPAVQNLFNTNADLRILKSRMRPINTQDSTQESRFRACVADPFAQYRLLIVPKGNASEDFGALATRREMMGYRAEKEMPWPILDTLAMSDALVRKVATREQRAEAERRMRDAAGRFRQSASDVGFPWVA